MKTATVSLKQLRTDPREYIRLLNSGYEVEITEHRKPLAKAAQPRYKKPKKGNIDEVIRMARSMPPTHILDPNEPDTPRAVKKAMFEALDKKYGPKQ